MSHVEQHLTELARDRYSAATTTERGRVLRSAPDLTAASREEVQAWWETRQNRSDGQPRAASSLSGEASHVRAFCRWAMTKGLTDHNAADWLPRVRQKHTMATPVGEGDLYRAVQGAPPKMRLMIVLAAMAGLRSAEIATVTWEDIDRGNGVLWVREGKGGKDRSVPLSSGLLVELGEPGEGLIVGSEMTAKAVSLAIGRYLRSKGIDLSAHKLRARYVTRFLAATGDLVAAAAAVGHSDVSTTARYAVASSDTMRRGAEAAGKIG